MSRTIRKQVAKKHKPRLAELRTVPKSGTQIAASKQQGYRIPLELWQELLDEVNLRKSLGLSFSSANAIAVEGIRYWLQQHKGGQ